MSDTARAVLAYDWGSAVRENAARASVALDGQTRRMTPLELVKWARDLLAGDDVYKLVNKGYGDAAQRYNVESWRYDQAMSHLNDALEQMEADNG